MGIKYIPSFVCILFIITAGLVVFCFYLMLCKPEQWLEWFVNRPYRWWGLQVSIVNKERFYRVTRFYAMIPIVMAIIGLVVVLIVWIFR